MALGKSIDVLVVGAGPVGLAAALALARRGRRQVEIVDEADRRAGLSFALALHPGTLALLDELGALEALLARGHRVERVALYDGAARRAALDLAALGGRFPYVLVLPQSELEDVLLGRLRALGIEVRWRHRLRRLEDGASAVACAIDRIDAESAGYAVARVEGVVGKSFEREIPLVLGADGHASLVRRQLGIALVPAGAAGTVAVFELEGEPPPGDRSAGDPRTEARITFAGELRSVWWPLPAWRTRVSFELAPGGVPTAEREKSRLPSIVPWLASPLDERRLRELVGERLPWHAAPSGRLVWSAAVRFERALAATFGRGRVWLAGDAAHLAFPFGVVSMNEGIVEAVDLAQRFAAVLDGGAPLAALADYGDSRSAHWQARLAPAAAPPSPADPWLAARAAALAEALPLGPGDAARLLAAIGSPSI